MPLEQTQITPKQLALTQADVLAPQVAEQVALEPKLASGIAAAMASEPVALAGAVEPNLASGIAAAIAPTPDQVQVDSDPYNDTVYDVTTGREYASPLIATTRGVKNYTTTKPENPFAAQLSGGVKPLNDYLSGLNQYDSKFVEVRNALNQYPEIAGAIKTLYDIDPNHLMFQGDGNSLNTAITSLQQQIAQKGSSNALKNFYKQQQSLVGFGEGDWLGSRNMGNESYASLQRELMGFTPVADQATWEETAKNTGGKDDLATLWRDPTSGLGIGVKTNKGQPSSLVYFDRNGQSLRQSIADPADLYENAERYGIDLSGVGQLEESLKSSGYDISPYNLYGPTSDRGVDLSGVAKGEGILDMATDEWLQRQFANFDWQDQEARKAGFDYNNTDVARKEAIQNNQMAKRMLGQFGLNAPTAGTSAELSTEASLASAGLQPANYDNSGPVDNAPLAGGLGAPSSVTTEQLYQNVLGRTPSQEEIDSWGFGSEVDAQELDKFLGAARNEAVTTMPKTGAVGNLAQQILAQGTTGKWSGEGFGSPEKSAYDMAALLAAQGITNINDFGVRSKVIPAHRELQGSGDSAYFEDVPETTVQEYYNKATGQPIQSFYDKAAGNVWGGTFAGEGSTSYGVQFSPDGTPLFYSQYGGSSNDFANLMTDLGPVAQLGLAVATGGMSLPYALATQFAVQVLGGADPGDALKGAALSYGLSQVPGLDVVKEGTAYLNTIDPSGVLASSLTKAATSGLSAAAMGGDVSQAMLSGAVSGGVSGAVNSLMDAPEFKGLTAAQKRIASNAAAGVLTGKPLDQVLINAAVAAARNEIKNSKASTGEKRADAGIAEQLSNAGLQEVNLPTGIQTASADGETPFRVESAGAPIFADSPQAESIRPPLGYRLMSTTEEKEVQEGDRTRYVKPAGSYYDYTANAWFTPTGEFDAATNVTDYSSLFGGDQANLTDEDIAVIRNNGLGFGSNSSDFGIDSGSAYQPSGAPSSGGADMGEMVITAPRDSAEDLGEMVITAPREPVTDVGEMIITAPRDTTTDLGEVVVTAPKEELEYPEMVITAPKEPVQPPTEKPKPAVPGKPTTPAQVADAKQQIALTINQPASSPIVQDIFEALYGTMEYLDIGEEFSPSIRKASPAATQKQQQQTKMAQGGYLDDLLAENMSVDDLLNLLR